MLERIYEVIQKYMNIVLGVFLSFMGIFLFANIVLRYFFNSGLVWAEEASRFLFVWITFIGAIGALKDGKHLGFTSLVKKAPLPLKKFFFLLSNLIVAYLLYLMFIGSIYMCQLGWHNAMPSTGIPKTFMWLVGIICSVAMFFIIAFNIYRAMFVPGAINKLIDMAESEEEMLLDELQDPGGNK